MQASALAEEILKTEYDAARIIYNRFQSAIAFKPTIMTILSPDVRFWLRLPAPVRQIVLCSHAIQAILCTGR